MRESRENVLVSGAINTDLVARVRRAPEAGETVTGTEFTIYGGGKGANQALSCVRSGVTTVMLGALGDDDFGRQRLADLHADGIDTSNVPLLVDAESGVALIVVDDAGENRISYVPGATRSVTSEQATSAASNARPNVILSTMELPHAALRALFTAGKSLGSKIVINATPEPAEGLALVAYADVLVVNETEASELLGGSTAGDWEAIARKLQRLGAVSVVITLGSEGAVAVFDQRVFRVPAFDVEVVDSTGAGDAFCGAFAAKLAKGGGMEQAMVAGVAAGSLAVTKSGAQRSMPTAGEIAALIASR